MKGSFIVFLALGLHLAAHALTFSNRYRSPRNPERRIRPATRLIVLHTTEAHARSSLNKLSERGEAHYCVTEDGTAYRIIDRDRVAFHAGRSMWNSVEDCDNYSIGIEVVGHHDKPITTEQAKCLKELLALLKSMYGISDGQVVCHSHVAYGTPNKWQKRRHRGRKRCGMLFAMWSVRAKLGLRQRPAIDPDVRAGRLVQGDNYLQTVLYGKTDTMVGRITESGASSSGIFAGLRNIFSIKKTPTPSLKANPPPKKTVAKGSSATKAKDSTPPKTAGFKKGPLIKGSAAPPKKSPPEAQLATAALKNRAPRTLEDLEALTYSGYRKGGPLGPTKSAFMVAGRAWQSASTYYWIKGQIVPGNRVNAHQIPAGTLVFYKAK